MSNHMKTYTHNKGVKPLGSRMLSLLLSLVLAFGLLPVMPATAMAEPEGPVAVEGGKLVAFIDRTGVGEGYLAIVEAPRGAEGLTLSQDLGAPFDDQEYPPASLSGDYEYGDVEYALSGGGATLSFALAGLPAANSVDCPAVNDKLGAQTVWTDWAGRELYLVNACLADDAYTYFDVIVYYAEESQEVEAILPEFSLSANGQFIEVVRSEAAGSIVYKLGVLDSSVEKLYLKNAESFSEINDIDYSDIALGQDGEISLDTIGIGSAEAGTYLDLICNPENRIYAIVLYDPSVEDYVTVLVEQLKPEPAADPEFALATVATAQKVGQEFTVNVSMENITAAAQAELTWSENLQLVKVEAGDALSGEDMAFENVPGNGLFSFVANEGEADGVVAVATFRCAAPGEAAVGLTEGLAGKTFDSAEYEIAAPEALALSIGLDGIMGDVNNNAKVNIVDAQIAYDLCTNKYAEGSDAAASLLACWGNGATLDMVKAIADVNTVAGLDAGDAFAIQYAVHHNGVFGD